MSEAFVGCVIKVLRQHPYVPKGGEIADPEAILLALVVPSPGLPMTRADIVSSTDAGFDAWWDANQREVTEAWPGRKWCMHFGYNALLKDLELLEVHDDTNREDMARWN